MPHEKRQFENGELYHIVTRRIGNELLFGDIHDYYRGIFSIYEFNNANSVRIAQRRQERARFKKAVQSVQGLTLSDSDKVRPCTLEPDKRDKMVEVLSFSLMPNHIHLILRQLKDNGISKFMQKFGSGYASYFKERYNQKGTGHFFQDRFVAVPITTDDQLRIVFVYVHTNAISLIEPNWKEEGIKNPKKVIKFLENYKWHSYPDYIGKKNFPSVTERKFLLEVMGGKEGCREAVENWVQHKEKLRKMVKRLDKLGLT